LGYARLVRAALCHVVVLAMAMGAVVEELLILLV
jgi:hypothetical protein